MTDQETVSTREVELADRSSAAVRQRNEWAPCEI